MEPYWTDGHVRLYHGDCREVLPALGLRADVVVADPPYGDSHMRWDRWPEGWPAVAAGCARAMWCFGSLRMFMTWAGEFDRWRFSQDIVWIKNMAIGFAVDRFRKRHELAAFWFQGNWNDLYWEVQRVPSDRPDAGKSRRYAREEGTFGNYGDSFYIDDGTRLATSVIYAANMNRKGLHPHEKPAETLRLLIAYSCPPGGLVLDPFAGGGSALSVARLMGRRAVGIEADERYCEVIATRLGQGVMFDGGDSEPATPVPVVSVRPAETPLFDVS